MSLKLCPKHSKPFPCGPCRIKRSVFSQRIVGMPQEEPTPVMTPVVSAVTPSVTPAVVTVEPPAEPPRKKRGRPSIGAKSVAERKRKQRETPIRAQRAAAMQKSIERSQHANKALAKRGQVEASAVISSMSLKESEPIVRIYGGVKINGKYIKGITDTTGRPTKVAPGQPESTGVLPQDLRIWVN